MSNDTTMRRLGDYIRQVDVRNRDLEVTNLKGLSIEKIFIESIANTIGTDLRGYKIVKPRQFAYVPVTSRNGEKITVALYDGKNNCIISQAYTAFEIIDEAELLPEYLMQWFRRPEFDRYARFHSHGSAREIFDWEEMCDVLLPVPPIEEQHEIVARHKAIEHKIDVNRRLIAKLEETARTIYRHTFVENIDPENLPDGWRLVSISDIAEVNTSNLSSKDDFYYINYLDSGSITNNYISGLQHIDLLEEDAPSRAKRKVKYNDIVYSTVRPNLKHFGLLKLETSNLIVSTAFAVIHTISNIPNEVIYLALTQQEVIDELQSIAEMSKATYPSITADDIMAVKFAIPTEANFSIFNEIFKMIDFLNKEISILTQNIVCNSCNL